MRSLEYTQIYTTYILYIHHIYHIDIYTIYIYIYIYHIYHMYHMYGEHWGNGRTAISSERRRRASLFSKASDTAALQACCSSRNACDWLHCWYGKIGKLPQVRGNMYEMILHLLCICMYVYNIYIYIPYIYIYNV